MRAVCLEPDKLARIGPMDDTYSIRDYGQMIADTERFGAYAKAIAAVVRPGDSVLEIGCGPGVFALLACRAGACRVYAIESQDVVHFARELAAANGLSDRIEFIQNDSRRTDLPERVSVIVSDIRGALPLCDHAVSSIEDARRRFLAPDGVLIPQKDILKVALIEEPNYYHRLRSPWEKAVPNLDLTSSLPLVLNWSYASRFKPDQLLSNPQTWCELNYAVSADIRAAADLSLRPLRNGRVHGLCVWFETQLFGEIGYSAGPENSNTVHGQIFLPLLAEVPVNEGQVIRVKLQADLVASDYVWRWETQFALGEGVPACHFRQSTFFGSCFSPLSLERHAVDSVPARNEAGEANLWLLQAMDGKTPLQRIAEAAAARFPVIFPRWEDALHRAAQLAAQFSR
jgi:type I protein arginine methyltransferase